MSIYSVDVSSKEYKKIQPGKFMFIILILFKCDVKQQNIHSDNLEIQG